MNINTSALADRVVAEALSTAARIGGYCDTNICSRIAWSSTWQM